MNSNTKSVIKSKEFASSSINPWLIWGCAALFYMYQFAIRISPSIMADQLMCDLEIQACALGTVAAFYYHGYTAMQLPAGLILDRIGVRYPLSFAALLCVTGSILFASSDNLTIMSVGRLLMGIGSSFGFLSCVKTASVWLPPHRLGLAIGLSFMFGTAGATFGGIPIATVSEGAGWQPAMYLLGGIGVLITFLVYSFVRDRKSNPFIIEDAANTEKIGVFDAISIVLKNPQTYILGAYGLIMYIPLSGFADLWGVPVLMQSYGIKKITATGTLTLFYIGMGVGAPLSAIFADYFLSHKKVLMGAAAGLAGLFCVMLYCDQIPFEVMQGTYVLAGFFAGAQFLAFACVCEVNPNQIGATASGIHNMLCMTSGVIFQPLIGKLLEINWDGAMVGGAPLYSQHDYHFALSSIPVCLGVGVLLCLLMKETYPRGRRGKGVTLL